MSKLRGVFATWSKKCIAIVYVYIYTCKHRFLFSIESTVVQMVCLDNSIILMLSRGKKT